MDATGSAPTVAGIASEVRRQAELAGIAVRFAGSYAVRFHCSDNADVLDRMGRASILDLDLVVPRRSGSKVAGILEGMGFVSDRRIAQATDGQHFYLVHPSTKMGVDIYAGGMNYCHPIPLEDRLSADPLTIPLAELLLSKLQVVKITDKDLQDTAVLLLSHEISHQDQDAIDGNRITEILAKDWGFYYTVVGNLNTMLGRLGVYALEADQREVAASRAKHLLALIEGAPKDVRWRLRARLGTKVSWYQEVEEK